MEGLKKFHVDLEAELLGPGNFLALDGPLVRRELALLETFPKIVTLCGSTRFKQEFIDANFRLTREGILVFSVGWFSHADGEIWEPTPEQKAGFDELHLRKIDLSDEIFVVNPVVVVCGRCNKPSRLFTELSQETNCCRAKEWNRRSYIGESTRREIEYATAKGKVVTYLNEPGVKS